MLGITVEVEKVLTLMKIEYELRKNIQKQWLKIQIQKICILSLTLSLTVWSWETAYAIFISLSFLLCKSGNNMCSIGLLWRINELMDDYLKITQLISGKIGTGTHDFYIRVLSEHYAKFLLPLICSVTCFLIKSLLSACSFVMEVFSPLISIEHRIKKISGYFSLRAFRFIWIFCTFLLMFYFDNRHLKAKFQRKK